MKNTILFTFIMFFSLCSAQVTERVQIDGKISVPMGDDPAGITIVNTSTEEGTFSSEAGTFSIDAAINDTLRISAVQFQEFSVVVDEGIVDSGQLVVNVSEAITELPEVVVTPVDLTGYVEVDVMRIPLEEIDLPHKSAAEIEDTEYDFRPDRLTTPNNPAMRSGMIYSGTDLATIFRTIFTSRSRSAVSWTSEADRKQLSDIDDEIQRLYNDEFFVERLGIQRNNIHEFIFFAEDNGLTEKMLKEENEMELIRFLMDQSERFKEVKREG